MPKFRKKPVVIEAEQLILGNAVTPFISAAICPYCSACPECQSPYHIHTLEGPHIASIGDWIIRGVKGEFYPCKPDIFAATYEEVE